MSDVVERWHGYNQQSWSERFAELDRRYRSVMEAATNIPALRASRDDVIRECADVAESALNAYIQVGIDGNERKARDDAIAAILALLTNPDRN